MLLLLFKSTGGRLLRCVSYKSAVTALTQAFNKVLQPSVLLHVEYQPERSDVKRDPLLCSIPVKERGDWPIPEGM